MERKKIRLTKARGNQPAGSEFFATVHQGKAYWVTGPEHMDTEMVANADQFEVIE